MKTKTLKEIREKYPKQSAVSWIQDLANEMVKRNYFNAKFYIDITSNDLIDYNSWLDMYYLQGLTPKQALDEDENKR